MDTHWTAWCESFTVFEEVAGAVAAAGEPAPERRSGGLGAVGARRRLLEGRLRPEGRRSTSTFFLTPS